MPFPIYHLPSAAYALPPTIYRLPTTTHFAGPLRVWGKLMHQKPLLLGGSIDRALDIYRRALQIAPHNSTTLLYYAESLIADQRRPPGA